MDINKTGLRARLNQRCFNRNVDLVYLTQRAGGSFAAGEPLVIKNIEEGAIWPVVTTLEEDQAQTLIDDLWQCGFRPTEGKGSAGSLAATERHLEDMRTLHFAKVEVDKP